MNNLKGYYIMHPEIDSLSSEWYVFTHKNKLYQISVSIDSFHNDTEYDLRIFSYNKFKPQDNIGLDDIRSILKNQGLESNIYSSKQSLKNVFSNLNSIIIKKQPIKNIYLSHSFNTLLEKSYIKNTINKYISDVYYELVMNKVK